MLHCEIPAHQSSQIESPGQPEGDLHHHPDLGPQKGLRCDGTVQEDVGLFAAEEHLSRGARHEHSDEDERHGMEVGRISEEGLPQEDQNNEAERSI